MIRFYCPEPLSGFVLHPTLAFRFTSEPPWRGPFDEHLPPNFFEKDAEFVDTPENADAIILPNNFHILTGEAHAYIAGHTDVAERLGIPIYAFAFNDLADGVPFDPRVRVFRLSTYRSTIQAQDIVVPTTAQDFDFIPRSKSELPLVSFCGFAGFKTLRQWMGYLFKNLQWDVKALHNAIIRARKQGIYWRRKMIAACRSPLVVCRFIIRRSFSGAMRTIELPPQEARAQFIENMRESDFVLTPKGDGNYSNRFLETLSMGRIPVLLNTDTVLPLEDVIDYSKIVVRVPMNQVHDTPELIRKFYDALSDSEWQDRQRLAHETFQKYLRQDAFFRYFFGISERSREL